MGDDEFHRVLLNRFQDLEASHAKLTEQLDVLKEEKEIAEVRRRKEGSLYGRILQSMGHAVYVTEASDGNIIYWNHSAESLFGWKDYEAVGQKATDLMIEEPNHVSIKKIVGMLNTGQSWSGQFPFKKRSGEIFMGLVTRSLLYEDSELLGVITVSSDAAIFSSINSEKIRTYQDHAYSQPRERKFNMKKILTPQIVSVPQLSSSVSNLVLVILAFLFSSLVDFFYSSPLIMVMLLNNGRLQKFFHVKMERMILQLNVQEPEAKENQQSKF